MKQLNNVKMGLGLFFVFIVFSVFVYLNTFQAFDYQVLTFFQKNIPRSLDLPFSYFSLAGSFEVATVILLLIVYFSSKINKISVLFFYAITLGIETLGKGIIAQIGPPIELLRTHFFVSFPSGSLAEGFFAYPSGHAARAAFISIILLFLVWKSDKLSKNFKFFLVGLILFFDFFMFISRIYLAEHWFSDVIGGLLLGTSMAFLAMKKPPLFIRLRAVAKRQQRGH